MPRLTGKDRPVEAQITLASGKVLDFKESLGDVIALSEVDTFYDKRNTIRSHYYTVTLARGQEDGV